MDEQQMTGPEIGLDEYIDQASQLDHDDGSSSEPFDANVAAGIPDGSGVTTRLPAEDPEKTALLAELQTLRSEREALAERERQRAIEEERLREEQFFASLEDLDPDSRALAAIQFRDAKHRQEVDAYRQRLGEIQRMADSVTQRNAKSQVAQLLAQRHGVPASKVGLLQIAETPEAMESLAKEIGGLQRSRKAAYMPSGDVASIQGREGPQKRSGDLDGLIGSRDYRRMSVRD